MCRITDRKLRLCLQFPLYLYGVGVLWKVFGAKWVAVTDGRRKMHNGELYGLYSSPNTIRLIKPMRVPWARHVARMGKNKNA